MLLKVGDKIRVKTYAKLDKEFFSKGDNPLFGWNSEMNELCGNEYVITSFEGDRIMVSPRTSWAISCDMIELMEAADREAELKAITVKLSHTLPLLDTSNFGCQRRNVSQLVYALAGMSGYAIVRGHHD